MEVLAVIRFITPCLGNVRGEELDRMPRDARGRVIFHQTWWRAGLGYAAQAACRYQKEVAQIQTDPVVEGELGVYDRHYSVERFQRHEAYLAGSRLSAKFMLPRRMSLEGFEQLLCLAGRYVGISPYGYRQDFGRFSVDSVVQLHSVKRIGARRGARGAKQLTYDD